MLAETDEVTVDGEAKPRLLLRRTVSDKSYQTEAAKARCEQTFPQPSLFFWKLPLPDFIESEAEEETATELKDEAASGSDPGHDMILFGSSVHFSNSISESWAKCSICMEETLCRPAGGQLCIDRGCKGSVCDACFQKHVTTTIDASRFAVPHIRCPSCFGFLPSACWHSRVDAEVVDQWATNAHDLLSLRCSECDEQRSLLVPGEEDIEEMGGDRADSASLAFEGLQFSRKMLLLKRWREFDQGDISPDEFLGELQKAFDVGSSADVSESSSSSDDNEGIEEGKPPTSFVGRFEAALSLIDDVGRRSVLQMAALRRYPKTTTRCCDAQHCFKCKVGSHHEGVSCEEVQRRQMPSIAVQFCPGCSVATLKTEGCNHIICLCGENWTWDGEEVWAEEWLST
eukprot:TRINITY_DN111139_c0_g1_i1.p1 TRINITY_DN111139_c0_g1~~TRINITY_DN111139_c0_g1_i1.p1  ORF type:complete len:400 (+),score=83.94 TRINITY_DN111139_c0_g1_i1:63-1262(+)